MRRVVAVLDAPATGFVALARVAGLDPARDFRGADLCNVDFGADDLEVFDFSGADLTGADLSRVTRLPTDGSRHAPAGIVADAAAGFRCGARCGTCSWPGALRRRRGGRTFDNWIYL